MAVTTAPPAGPTPMAKRSAMEQIFWGGFYASGLIGALLVYGLLQERIMSIPYGGEVFEFSVFLVFANRMAAVVFAIVMAISHKESLTNAAPIWKYLIISFSNVYASTCQYEALKYVSFAVQMLGKSFKMLPVMFWGMAIIGKKYTALDWGVAIAVTGGVTEFLMTGPTSSSSDNGSSVKGFVWLLAFLCLDGLTSTMQEKLFKEHKTSKYNQMMYVNGLSAITSLCTLITTGTFFPAWSFFLREPQFAVDATMLSVSAVGGQFFIYSQVKEFGALVFAATMNVRQVVSILLSYLAYHHDITWLQIGGLVMVFSALFYKSLVGVLHQTSYRSSTTEAVAAAVKAEKASFANQADLDARSYKAAEKA
mmetsp:Transcript_135724/g.351910  ORF Transcript_135724/g.351910 Transcript_135724/m.351910 type:complete len:366 (+) Transcript_135724:87-1184(+)